jgi:hypothetical protein
MDDTITLSSSEATADSSYTISSSLGANVTVTGIGVPWSNTTSVSNTTYTLGPNWNNGTSGKICLEGPNADIEVNGESMISMLKNIEQRLNILQPNTELESEWEELRVLGEQYRALEHHIQEKMATWSKLTAMPAPDIN